MSGRRILLCACLALALLQGCRGFATPAPDELGATAEPLPMHEVLGRRLQGYLPGRSVPDSLALLSPPPQPGSGAADADLEANREALARSSPARIAFAVQDADLSFPHAAAVFACALGVGVGEKQTPVLYRLLRRTLVDAIRSTDAAKGHYRRARPNVVNGKPICSPAGSAGSYPSGHAAVAAAWSLILAELAPEHASAILARGRSYGESRVLCNAHWQSDVTAGWFMGATTVAVLHAQPEFRADLEAARSELVRPGAGTAPDAAVCAAEQAVLAAPFPVPR
jgi:acid phosphatase (class A)